MPNSANKSDKKSGIVQPKKRATKASAPNPDQEQSGKKKGGGSSKGNGGGSGKSSNGGS